MEDFEQRSVLPLVLNSRDQRRLGRLAHGNRQALLVQITFPFKRGRTVPGAHSLGQCSVGSNFYVMWEQKTHQNATYHDTAGSKKICKICMVRQVTYELLWTDGIIQV